MSINSQNDLAEQAELTQQPCLNCKQPLAGAYCSHCGQPKDTVIRSFWHLIVDYLENTFNYDSRLFRTLPLLLLKPGKLTNEYLLGHRARYVPPLRMYLIISLVFFLTISLSDSSNVTITDTAQETDHITTPLESSEKPTELPPIPTDAVSDPKKFNADLQEYIQKSNEILGEKPSEEKTLEEIRQELEDDLNINLAFFSDEFNQRIRKNLKNKVATIIWQVYNDPSTLRTNTINLISKLMFLLLPVFALLLKLIYIRSGRLYMEHLIQVLHTHCFIYLALLLAPLPDYLSENYTQYLSFAEPFANGLLSLLETVLIIYLFTYVYIVTRIVYQQSWLKSAFKYFLSSTGYFFLMMTILPIILIMQLI